MFNIDKDVTLSQHYQSNGQVEACIQLVKCTIKKCRQTNNSVHFALLQIRSTPISARLPSPATMLFNRLIRTLLLQIGKEPINVNKDDKYCKALISKNNAYTKKNDTHKDSTIISPGSTAAVQMEDRIPWHMAWLLKETVKTTEDDPTECKWWREVE